MFYLKKNPFVIKKIEKIMEVQLSREKISHL